MTHCKALHDTLQNELGRVLVGQEDAIRALSIAVATSGHVLLEGVPGVAKTLLARAAAKVLGFEYRRVQFTADLMPSDIVGTQVFDFAKGSFHFVEGPVFTQVFLADEINRAPGKTQAALLEAMQEGQVSIEGETRPLPEPFFVVATQNPVEHEGTYPLPEAQLDRFLFKVEIGYPSLDEEVRILERNSASGSSMSSLLEPLGAMTEVVDPTMLARELGGVHVEDKIRRYLAELVRSTRTEPRVELGASPRAAVMLQRVAACEAAIDGRDFVVPDDIKRNFVVTMRHRITLTAGAEVEGLTADRVLGEVANGVEVPR